MESLMEIPDAPELFLQPALLDFPLIIFELLCGCIAGAERLIDCFRREHSALDGRVDSLEALGIQQARRIADDQATIHVTSRHGIPAAVGNRLRAVTNQLAAFENPLYERMRFEFLKCFVRIEKRIVIFEAHDHAERDAIIAQAVNPAAAIEVRVSGQPSVCAT